MYEALLAWMSSALFRTLIPELSIERICTNVACGRGCGGAAGLRCSGNTLQGRLSLGDMMPKFLIVVDIDHHHAICWLIHLNHVVHSVCLCCRIDAWFFLSNWRGMYSIWEVKSQSFELTPVLSLLLIASQALAPTKTWFSWEGVCVHARLIYRLWGMALTKRQFSPKGCVFTGCLGKGFCDKEDALV